MRSRFPLAVLVLAILLVAGFAALNWPEFVRSTPLSFGPVIMDAPLGLFMLSILVITLLAFLISTSVLSTRHHFESRHHHKTLEAQRELADKAEASRFTELRTHLDTQLRELRQRDAIAATEFEKALALSQRETRAHLEQMNRTVITHLGELEQRIDARFAHLPGFVATPVRPAPLPVHTVAPNDVTKALEREAGLSEDQVREQRRLAERLHIERLEAEEKRAEAAVEAGPSIAPERARDGAGWRRWF